MNFSLGFYQILLKFGTGMYNGLMSTSYQNKQFGPTSEGGAAQQIDGTKPSDIWIVGLFTSFNNFQHKACTAQGHKSQGSNCEWAQVNKETEALWSRVNGHERTEEKSSVKACSRLFIVITVICNSYYHLESSYSINNPIFRRTT